MKNPIIYLLIYAEIALKENLIYLCVRVLGLMIWYQDETLSFCTYRIRLTLSDLAPEILEITLHTLYYIVLLYMKGGQQMKRISITVPDMTIDQIEDLKKIYEDLEKDADSFYKLSTSDIIRRSVNFTWNIKTSEQFN